MNNNFDAFSVNEKIKLVEKLWESIETERYVRLSHAQLKLLEKRIKQHQQNPGKGKPWKEVRKKYFA